MKNKNNIQLLNELHINRLNNIQSVISRLSNIGFTLISICLLINSIMIPLTFSIDTVWWIKIINSIILLISTSTLSYCHYKNLNNERKFRDLYDILSAINIEDFAEKDDPWLEHSKINIKSIDKLQVGRISISNKNFKSWTNIVWFLIFLIDLIVLVTTIIMKFV